MSKVDDDWKELLELRAQSELMGTVTLCEAQVIQLKNWAPLAISHANDIEIAVQLPWIENEGTPQEISHSIYRVEFRATATRKKPKDLKKRLLGLDRSIKMMLGDQFETKVKVNGVSIFQSKGKLKKNSPSK